MNFLLPDIFKTYKKLHPVNQSPLKIATFDGLDSPYHPSVLYFEDGWNGWKYWMVETPFSFKCRPYVDRNECPSIHVSNDGHEWTVPHGLVNPLVNFGATGENNLDYYSDPHLLLNAEGELECWYRLTERHGDVDYRHEVSLRRVKSADGIHWSKEEILKQLNLNSDAGLGQMVVSPAVLLNDHEYKMWYVDSEAPEPVKRNIAMSSSSDGKVWCDRKVCNLIGLEVNPWHIDVVQIKGAYWLTVYDKTERLTLWSSHDGINFKYCRELLRPSGVPGSFYAFGLYRACLSRNHNGGVNCYFSAHDYRNTYIGIMSGITPEALNLEHNGKFRGFCSFLNSYLAYRYRRIIFIVRNMARNRLSR